MRKSLLTIFGGLMLAVGLAPLAHAERPDAVLAQFFAIWDDNGRVTEANVQSLYARRVVYYGRALSTAGVYADKRAFIRRWPDRRYSVVPGTVRKGCDASGDHCDVEVTLAWHAASAARGVAAGGFTRVSLSLGREDGELKIVQESGRRTTRPDG